MRSLIGVAGALLLFAPIVVQARDAGIVSGAYDDAMLIGYDPVTKMVSGYFNMVQGEQPTFSCIFFLKGKLQVPITPVATYYPGTPADDLIKGQLVLEAREKFRVRLPTEHGGCWNVEHFADKDQPAEFTLQAAHPWTSVAVVMSAKAYFFDTPASGTHRKGYVVKGDGLGVRAAQPGWLQVDFVGGEKPISGWIRQSDVFATN